MTVIVNYTISNEKHGLIAEPSDNCKLIQAVAHVGDAKSHGDGLE